MAHKKMVFVTILLVAIGLSIAFVPWEKCPACDAQGKIYLGRISGQPPYESDYTRCAFCEGAAKISCVKNCSWASKKVEVEKRIAQQRDAYLK